MKCKKTTDISVFTLIEFTPHNALPHLSNKK